MKIRLPGRCIVCHEPVVWTGKRWRPASLRGRGKHVCPVERGVCGAWMPNARERCARAAGHNYDHRTRYAMDNALERATGHRKAA